MDEVKVDVVELEASERRLEGALRPFVSLIFDPQLRGDEQLLAWNASGSDRPPHSFLVYVRASGIKRAVAGFQCVENGLFRLVGWDLEDAEPEDGHLDVVAQGHGGDRHAGIMPPRPRRPLEAPTRVG